MHLAVDVRDKVYPVSRLRIAPRLDGPPPPDAAAQRAIIAQALGYSQPERAFTQRFIAPCAGRPTSPFSVRRTFHADTKSRYLGLDLQRRGGEPVYATNDGTMALCVAHFFHAGNAIVIDHGEGLITGIFHLSGIAVAQGQRVRRGDVNGRSGSTGWVTGPHVHFCVTLGGHFIDPADLLSWALWSGDACMPDD